MIDFLAEHGASWKAGIGRLSMRLDLYLAETCRLTAKQVSLLEQAAMRLEQASELSALEQSGMLHALHIMVVEA